MYTVARNLKIFFSVTEIDLHIRSFLAYKFKYMFSAANCLCNTWYTELFLNVNNSIGRGVKAMCVGMYLTFALQ